MTAAITDKRLIICKKKFLGADYAHYDWLNIDKVNLREGMLKSCIEFRLLSGSSLVIGNLPKQEAFKFFSRAQERCRFGYAERRKQQLEEAKARSGGADITIGTQSQTKEESVYEKIKQLRTLLSEGLITEEEYQQKKKVLLDQF
jgi:hypothetical protein